MEFVYVVKSEHLDLPLSEPGFHSFKARSEQEEVCALFRQRGFFIEREWAEKDPSFKQIIPYAIVRDSSLKRVFLMERIRGQTESRLHHKLSIGVGGHINPVDQCRDPGNDILAAGLHRELSEEVALNMSSSPRWIGWIFDGSNEVGSVHIGLVSEVITQQGSVRIIETEHMRGGFEGMDRVRDRAGSVFPRLETWSQLVVEHLADHEEARERGQS